MDPEECSVSDQMMKFILFWVCWVPYYKINHVFSQNADTVTSSSSVTGNNATVTEKPDATPTPSVESVASEASSAPSTATLVNEATTTETSPVQETASPADPTPAPAPAPAPDSQVRLHGQCLFVCLHAVKLYCTCTCISGYFHFGKNTIRRIYIQYCMPLETF